MGQKSPQTEIESPAVALRALQAGFRPLARLLLLSGVQIRDVIETVKTVFVEVARADFARKGKPANFSRTALLTGIDRKEVRRLSSLLDTTGDPVASSRQRHHRIASVLDTWNTDAAYTDQGQPRVLTRLEFDRLARMHAGDIPTSAILREMILTGAVSREPNDRLRAVTRYYELHRADPEYLLRAGSVLEDIGTTVVFNLMRNDENPSRVEGRATVVVNETEVDDFRQFIQIAGRRFLKEIDDWLVERSAERGPRVRVGVGIYQIQDPNHEKDSLDSNVRNDLQHKRRDR